MRQLWSLPGGIHPDEHKRESTQRPLAHAGIPDRLVLPLVQGGRWQLEPRVEIGQRVLKGEVIARARDDGGLPLHAATSGTVIAIQEHPVPHPTIDSAPCLVLEPDGRDEWRPRRPRDAAALGPDQLLDIVRDAGIAGLGGAGFPTATKLASAAARPIEYLIINGVECEPYITADDMLMRMRAAEIVAGVKILEQIVQPARATLIAIEDNKPEAIAAIGVAAAGTDIEVVTIPTRYPSGGERQLIYILTGEEVPSGGLPADIGVICQNVGTAAAIYRAVALDEPLVSRIVTVTGGACEQPRNLDALIGTPVTHLLGLGGFHAERCRRLIMGGPMMGFEFASGDVPILATSNCVLAATADDLPAAPPEQPCIRCGLCADACPAGLLPQQLYWFARAGNLDQLAAHQLADCIECGACAWVCPSSIPLVNYYRDGKLALRQRDRELTEALRAKRRFEARTARQERETREREERRRSRREALLAEPASPATATDGGAAVDSTSGGSAADKAAAIRAAVERARARKQGKPAADAGEQS